MADEMAVVIAYKSSSTCSLGAPPRTKDPRPRAHFHVELTFTLPALVSDPCLWNRYSKRLGKLILRVSVWERMRLSHTTEGTASSGSSALAAPSPLGPSVRKYRRSKPSKRKPV